MAHYCIFEIVAGNQNFMLFFFFGSNFRTFIRRLLYFWITSCCRSECLFYQSKCSRFDPTTSWYLPSDTTIFGYFANNTFLYLLTWEILGKTWLLLKTLSDWWVWMYYREWNTKQKWYLSIEGSYMLHRIREVLKNQTKFHSYNKSNPRWSNNKVFKKSK